MKKWAEKLRDRFCLEDDNLLWQNIKVSLHSERDFSMATKVVSNINLSS